MQYKDIKIAVVGLGYVGLPLAIEFGSKRSVIGFDINETRINELKKGLDVTLETNQEEIKNAAHLSFTNKIEDIKECKIYIITLAASATLILLALWVPAEIISLYKLSTIVAISGVEPEVTFLIFVILCSLSPGFILSGEYPQ